MIRTRFDGVKVLVLIDELPPPSSVDPSDVKPNFVVTRGGLRFYADVWTAPTGDNPDEPRIEASLWSDRISPPTYRIGIKF